MQLKEIDKAIYRNHLNRVMLAAIIILLTLSLGVSTILIALIGNAEGSNLALNTVGVVVGAITIGLLLYYFQHHPYMNEVMYVWRLKQELNRIYRKSAKVKAALEGNNIAALVITNFNLKGSSQLYELDDNDLTSTELKQEIIAFDNKIQSLGLTISTDDYNKRLLNELN